MAEPTAIGQPAYKTYAEYIEDVNQEGIYDTLLKDLPTYNRTDVQLTFTFFDLCPEGKVTQHCIVSSDSWQGPPTDGKLEEIMSSLQKHEGVSSRVVIIHDRSVAGLAVSFLPTWAVNVLGLGANIEPSFFERYYASARGQVDMRYHYWYRMNDTYMKERLRETSQYLLLGGDWVLILNQPPLPKTVLIILGHSTVAGKDWISANTSKSPLEILSEKASSMSSGTPNRTTEPPVGSRAGTLANAERLVTWFHKCALEASKYGSDAFRFSCIEALVEYHSTLMPQNMPIFEDWDGPFYSRVRSNTWLGAPPQILWNRLRTEVDDARMFLNKFPKFVSRNFDICEPTISDAFRHVEEKYKDHIARIEVVETRFRDQLSIVSSAKGIEMAELSIQESKRVMLLTLLAFVFVPISLATSIFGMNIQEIDGTGHKLWVFIVTTIILLVIAAFLFAISTMVTKYRRHLTKIRRNNRQDDRWVRRSVAERLLFVPE